MKFRFAVLLAFLIGAPAARVAGAPPENDNFSRAALLTGTNLVVFGSNVDATPEIGEPVHAGNPGRRSVWWIWTAPASGSVLVQTTGSSFDTLLAAYTGSSFGDMNLVASDDDFGGSVTSRIEFNVDAGTIYHFAVDGFDGQTGAIQLALQFRTHRLIHAPNDDFRDRIAIRGSAATASAGTFYATREPGEPDHAHQSGGASLWWTWTPPVSGTVEIDTRGSDFDTLLAVYTGSVLTNLTAVASNDDLSTSNFVSRVRFGAVEGTTYQIAVDGYFDATGNLILHLVMPGVIWLDSPKPLDSGGVLLVATAPPGGNCAIEGSSDLRNWQSLASGTNAAGTVKFTIAPGSVSDRQFYRARRDDSQVEERLGPGRRLHTLRWPRVSSP